MSLPLHPGTSRLASEKVQWGSLALHPFSMPLYAPHILLAFLSILPYLKLETEPGSGWALSEANLREACLQRVPAACPPATVLVISPSDTLREGSEANLTCNVSLEVSVRPANFSWFRNGVLWTEGPLETIRLQPVARTDAAIYACRLLTEDGAQLSAPVVLSVLCG